MDVAELTVFLTVAEELHFGRAGHRLFLPQPHVSRTIAQLEKNLGVTLFHRTTRRVELTPAGKALVRSARIIVAASAEARLDVKSAERGESGRVSVSFAGPSSYAVVGILARAVRERYPSIELSFRPGRFGPEVLGQVVDGTTDLAMARFKEPPMGIAARPIAEEHYVVSVPRTHRLAHRSRVTIEELRDEPFVTLPPIPGSVVLTDFIDHCHEAGFAPNIVQTVPDSWTINALVAAGVGASFTVDTALAHLPTDNIHVLEFVGGRAATYAYLVWRESSSNPALHKVLETSARVLPTPAGFTPNES